MVLLLNAQHKHGVCELSPLQLGDFNTLLIVVVGVVFAVVVVVLIANALRRSSAMSDELSTEWEKKFKSIRPEGTTTSSQQPATLKPQPFPQQESRSRDSAAYNAFQTELRENRGRLQRNLQEITALKEDETRMRNDILGLKMQVSSLQERLSASQEEIRKMKAQIDAGARPSQEPPKVQEPTPQRPPPAPPQPAPLVQRQNNETWISRHFGNLFNPRTCPTCGRQVRARDLYCDSCGQPLPAAADQKRPRALEQRPGPSIKP